MKNYNIILAVLVGFFMTNSALATTAYIKNEAWNIAGSYYDIYVSVNNKLEQKLLGHNTGSVGNLENINEIKIRRSGVLESVSPWSYIPGDKLAQIKRESQEKINREKIVILVIGATYTGFGLYTHQWVNSLPTDDAWSVFESAKSYMAKEKIKPIDFFSGGETKDNIEIALRVLDLEKYGYTSQHAIPSNIIDTWYNVKKEQYKPNLNLTVSIREIDFNAEAMKIINRAYEILKIAYK